MVFKAGIYFQIGFIGVVHVKTLSITPEIFIFTLIRKWEIAHLLHDLLEVYGETFPVDLFYTSSGSQYIKMFLFSLFMPKQISLFKINLLRR